MLKGIKKRSCLQRITPYVPGKPVEELEREYGIKDAVKLASNENPSGPSPLAVEAIRNSLTKINLYPDGRGYLLKNELAGRFGLQEDNVILGNGADELINLVCAAYINPGDEVIIADPSFTSYESAVIIMDGVLRKIPTTEFFHDLGAMSEAVNSKTRLVFICNPNNPTGTIVTHRDAERFLDGLPPGILVVMDEAYYEYVTDPGYPASLNFLADGRNILILRTFSKMYGLAGLRIGYGLADEEVIKDLHSVRAPFNVNSVAQAAALAALQDTEHVCAVRELNDRSKKYLYGEFERMGLAYVPTETNFVFLDVKTDSRRLYTDMLRKGVIVRPGDVFGYPQFLRVTFGKDGENRRFIKVLEQCLD